MRGTLQRLRAVDEAWNARRWSDYSGFFDDGLLVWASGDQRPHDKVTHLKLMAAFCTAFPDACRHTDNYMELFASHDGLQSASVTRVTGTATGALRLPGRLPLLPISHRFDITVARICRWRNGRLVELREFIDQDLMVRQLSSETLPHHPQGGIHG